jgi:scavenger receptor class B, member 1
LVRFVGRNGSETHDGTFTMFTGEGNIKNLGMLDLWNGKNETGLFSGQCSAVYGTTGELNPPISGREDLSVFAPDVCRTITLKNDGTFKRFGITGRKWIGDDRVLDNGVKFKQNACYCAASPDECPDMNAGVYNASSCQFGAPAFVSFPHFYLADPSFLANIDGLSPNRSEHEFYIAMEPQTGIPLEIRAQFQINLLLKPYEDLK